MKAEKCPMCRAPVSMSSATYGFMKCASCGGKYRMPPEVYSGMRYAEATADGKPILQVYDDLGYGVSVITTNNYGEYVYGKSYDPSTGIWGSGVYKYQMNELADSIYGRLLIDNIGLGDIRKVGGTVTNKARKARAKRGLR